MNESNQRGTPPLKLSFFPFFLSLLLSRKKKRRRATTSRETTEEVRARRASRARAIPRRLKLERASRHRRCCCCLLFNAIILDAQFFFVSSFNGNYPTNFYQQQQSHPFSQSSSLETKKKGGDFYGHGQKCSLSLCVVIKSSLRPPLAFFSPFFSSAHQEQQHSSCVVSDTFWTGSADDALSFSLSWGSLSLSLARKRREERTRARSESNTASRRVSRAGRCIRARARARGKTVTRVLCSRESKRESLLVSRVAQKRRGKERKVFCNRSLSCARACVAHGLSIYSSIDRSIGKEEQK